MTKSDSDLPGSLAAPARRALAQAGCTRIEQFAELTEAEIRQLPAWVPRPLSSSVSPSPPRGCPSQSDPLHPISKCPIIRSRSGRDRRRRVPPARPELTPAPVLVLVMLLLFVKRRRRVQLEG
jgi:hypothetical protein